MNQVLKNVKHVIQGQQVHQDPPNVKFVKQESSLQKEVLRTVALAKKMTESTPRVLDQHHVKSATKVKSP
jgi:hypothetical protein